MNRDPVLQKVVEVLTKKYRCHTVLLYGSRARGTATPASDYDVMGVRRTGKKVRIASRSKGVYLDIFVFSEKDLQSLGESHLYMSGAQILFQRGDYGIRFQRRLARAARRPPPRRPPDEINMMRVWAKKMLERSRGGDIEGNYRRSWLQMALLEDYFVLRQKRFEGSKAAFAWLKAHDPKGYRLFDRALASPSDDASLERLVDHVVSHS
jgi:hypothetical protein